jgi:3-phosphoshikimate 1-carboxyvinyltransferase
MKQYFKSVKKVIGELSLPGDKSISHRALIFSAMASGSSTIDNLSDGLDVNATLNCLKQLGTDISCIEKMTIVQGCGFKGFKKPGSPLNCQNSGTTARLLSGLLIAQKFSSNLTGDDSLSKRPMRRIIEPLERMGGMIHGSNSTLPLVISPSEKLSSIDYHLEIPSAQVKSAVLIAGLHIEDETIITEKFITRDHTEKMLGLDVQTSGEKVISKSSYKNYPQPNNYFIPGDISSASFLIVAALLTKDSELIIKNVSLNPTRTGIIQLLKKMGAKIHTVSKMESCNESYGDLMVSSSQLKNLFIGEEIIPSIIDEIPILAVAGAFAEGRFEIRNCKELRVKESDRIKSICYNLKLSGLTVEEYEDGFSFEGRLKNEAIIYESFSDHRIAMAFAVLSILNKKGGAVNAFECVNISNPGFLKQLHSVCEYS